MKNLKIGVRLGVGFGILIAVLLLSALFAVRNMGVLANITKDLYNHPMTVTNAILAADGNVVRMHRSMKDVALAKTPEDVQKAANAVDGYEKHVYEDMKVVKSAFLGPPKMVEDITRPIAEWKPIRDRVIALMKEGKAEEAANITKTEGVVKTDEIRKAVGELKEWAQKKGVAFFENAEKTRSESVWIFVIANAIGIVLAVIVTFYISSSITNPIREAVGVAEALAKGDLTQKIEAKSKDETGQLLAALGNTVMQLKGIMGGIKESTETISTASSQIAQGNADLSQRTEEQASSLEETASSMEELTSTVKQNAENAKQANQLAISASAVAVKGGAVVSQVVSTMSSINDSSKKIVDIIGVIDGIAFQTNILALNAAVEAARAGEQGRGFAVVASEVRNLAQKSAAAAKEIKALISDSVEKVGTGTKLVDEAGKTMEEIVTSVKRVTDIMSEITAASQEQSSGIEQVNQAITQMDQVTQQNAALVEEAAAAAESMQEQAQNLAQAVSVFKLDHQAAGGMARIAERKEKPAPATAAERRSPNRPTNVARLSAKAEKQMAVSAPRAKKVAGGAEDDWKEF